MSIRPQLGLKSTCLIYHAYFLREITGAWFQLASRVMMTSLERRLGSIRRTGVEDVLGEMSRFNVSYHNDVLG